MSFANAGYGPGPVSTGGTRMVRMGDRSYTAEQLGFVKPVHRVAKRARIQYPISAERVAERLGKDEFQHPVPKNNKRNAAVALGPPGSNVTLNANRSIRLAKNRTQPIPYQASVVNYANFTRPQVLFDIRRQNWERVKDREKDLVAPLGTADCFVVRKSHFVYEVAGRTPIAPRQSVARNAHVNVTDCVNGLLWSDILVFVGAALTPPKPSHPDPVGTVQTCGTITSWHTGSVPLHVGETAYASIVPATVQNDRGVVVPAYPVLGTAGEMGEVDAYSKTSQAKFFPSIFSLKGNDNDAYILGLEHDIETLWEEHDVEHVTGANVVDKVKEILYALETKQFARAAKDLPARKYAAAYALQHLYNRHSGTNSDSDHSEFQIAQVVVNKAENYFRAMNEASVRFHNNLGMHSMPYTHPLLTASLRERFNHEDYWNGKKEIIEGYLPHAAIVKYLQELCNYYAADQRRFLRRSIVGTVLSDTLPGSSLDINMGHTFYC
jgi:hypothetical protein